MLLIIGKGLSLLAIMKVKTFSYHRIKRLLLSLLHEILTLRDILKKRRQQGILIKMSLPSLANRVFLENTIPLRP